MTFESESAGYQPHAQLCREGGGVRRERERGREGERKGGRDGGGGGGGEEASTWCRFAGQCSCWQGDEHRYEDCQF